MKTVNTTALAALLALAATVPEETEARSYGSLLAPRSYRYNRPRDPFDLVSEFFHTPFYNNVNSLMKQQQAAVDRLSHSASPRYAVSDEDGVMQLEVELPGVLAKDLDVELEDDRFLRIKGSRKQRDGSAESTFDLSFELAEGVDPDRLTVKLSAGILQVQVPKKEKVVKKLEITTDEAADELLQIKTGQEAHTEGSQEKVEGIVITEDAAEE